MSARRPNGPLRRFRLQEVALRIERGEAPNLARLAADLGYVDQAHLARDFKAAVGKSPSAFAAGVEG
ncbi:MAG: helix-turn-helix domain-containing protein [Polyangiaceae bacterium]|nr:helix-turn-helix domain-containing protein [Polyangiaceae bacterium]